MSSFAGAKYFWEAIIPSSFVFFMNLNLNISSCLTTPVRAKSAKMLFIDYLVEEQIHSLMGTLEAVWLFPLSKLSSAYCKLDIRFFTSHTWLDSYNSEHSFSVYRGKANGPAHILPGLEASALGNAKSIAHCVYAKMDKRELFVFVLSFQMEYLC